MDTTESHRAAALDHLRAAKRARAELAALYADAGTHDRVRIAELHDTIRWELANAKIHALLTGGPTPTHGVVTA